MNEVSASRKASSERDLRLTVCPCAAIRRAARALTQLYDLVLTPAEIKVTQFTILHALEENGELAQWQMSRQLGVSTEGLSRRLASLRKASWVQMRKGTVRGEHLYSLTTLGKTKLDQAMPYWRRAQERLYASSPEADWSSLIMLADRISLAARAAEHKRTTNGVPSALLGSCSLSPSRNSVAPTRCVESQ